MFEADPRVDEDTLAELNYSADANQGEEDEMDRQHSVNCAMQSTYLTHSPFFFADDAHLDNLRKSAMTFLKS